MTDGTSSSAPLAARPAAGTDAAATVADASSVEALADATVPSDRGGKPFWARLDSPFTAGLLLTLGGLVAVVLGIALTNIATVIVYIALAMFASLGLDPVIKWFERHNVKRPWAIAIVFLTFGVIGVGLLWLVVPTLIDQISAFITGIPDSITNFETTDTYAWLEGIFGPGLTTLVDELQKFLTNPANIAAISGGLLKVGVGIATAVSGALIIIVLTLYFVASLPAHQGVADAVRAGAQPAQGARHDQPDHRIGRRLSDGNGHPGVLQLRGGLPAALVPRAAVPAADGRARVLDHDHPARRTRALLDLRHRAGAVHEPGLRPDLRRSST